MHNACQSIYGFPVQQQVQADQVGLALLPSLVVEAGVARGDGLQGVVEVASQLCQGQSVSAGQAFALSAEAKGQEALVYGHWHWGVDAALNIAIPVLQIL